MTNALGILESRLAEVIRTPKRYKGRARAMRALNNASLFVLGVRDGGAR